MDACHVQAITFEKGLSISEKGCTSCMLCVSACPSEAFTIMGQSLGHTLSALRKADKPVLACSLKNDLPAHASGPCLGFLSKEYLASLPIILEKSIQLNLSQCSRCDNSHIIEVLMNILADTEGVVPVLSVEELDYIWHIRNVPTK
jgi:Fe-S-cluster-containing hydrogenase component 2